MSKEDMPWMHEYNKLANDHDQALLALSAYRFLAMTGWTFAVGLLAYALFC